jgi:hypothetical protein
VSTNLIRLESDDPRIAGFAITFDSGVAKQVTWTADTIISPALDAAKQYTASVIDALVKENREREVRDTNWVSVVAAVHRIVREFNGKLHDLERERNAATLQ